MYQLLFQEIFFFWWIMSENRSKEMFENSYFWVELAGIKVYFFSEKFTFFGNNVAFFAEKLPFLAEMLLFSSKINLFWRKCDNICLFYSYFGVNWPP